MGFSLCIDLFSFADAVDIIKAHPDYIYKFNGIGWSGGMTFEGAVNSLYHKVLV